MDNVLKIYKSTTWKKVRYKQLVEDHFECQRCKHNGKYSNLTSPRKYTRAILVHHDFRVRQYPMYAFKSYANGKRNLYSLCQSCHEIEHEEERAMIKRNEELNEEKW